MSVDLTVNAESLSKLSLLWSKYKEVNGQMAESKWFPTEGSMITFSEFATEFMTQSVLGFPQGMMVDVFNEATAHMSNLIIYLGSIIQDCKWANGLLSAFDDIGVPQQELAEYTGTTTSPFASFVGFYIIRALHCFSLIFENKKKKELLVFKHIDRCVMLISPLLPPNCYISKIQHNITSPSPCYSITCSANLCNHAPSTKFRFK
jgi:hypothetical protein